MNLIWVAVFVDFVAVLVPTVTVAPVNPVPVIVTVVPVFPLVGVIFVITGGGRTVSVDDDTTVPAAPVNVTVPVFAPVGTTNVTVVEVDDMVVAATVPINTFVTPCKFDPERVSVSPTFTLKENAFNTGGGSNVNVNVDDTPPGPVTYPEPDTAFDGTTKLTDVNAFADGVIDTPFNDTDVTSARFSPCNTTVPPRPPSVDVV